jgi:hypothetical protein
MINETISSGCILSPNKKAGWSALPWFHLLSTNLFFYSLVLNCRLGLLLKYPSAPTNMPLAILRGWLYWGGSNPLLAIALVEPANNPRMVVSRSVFINVNRVVPI